VLANTDAYDYFQDKGFLVSENYWEFQPEKLVTNAEFLKLALLAFGTSQSEIDGCNSLYFHDVKSSDWFAPHVCTAKEKGYLESSGKVFRPHSSVTWLEAIQLVAKILDEEIKENQLSKISNLLSKKITRKHAIGLLYVAFSRIEEQVEEDKEEPTEEKEEEMTQERKNQLAAIARTQPGTGGGGGGGGAPAPVPTPNPAFQHNPNLPTSNSRGLWVWGHWPNLKNNPTAQEEFFNFLAAPHGNAAYAIDRIFLSGGGAMDFESETDIQAMRDFITLASQNNIAVEYLSGDANWVITGNTDNALIRCQNAIDFNLSTLETNDDFAGVHFDIEPHTLGPEWSQNNGEGSDDYNDEFQNNFISIMRDCESMIVENEQNLSLTAAIPAWYESIVGDLWNPLTSSDSSLDYIAIMNYTDDQNTFINIAQNDLGNTSIPLMFGAETNENDDPSITFFEEGYLEMENVFTNANSQFDGNGNFAGFAIHYYTPYTTMIDELPQMSPSDCYTPVIPINGLLNQTRVWPMTIGLVPDIMSSPFGSRLQASMGYIYDFHRGVDIPATTGTPVYAVADGTVTTLYVEGEPGSPYPSGGTVVGIRHEDNGTYYSLYMHLDSFSVVQDQVVVKGEQIGLSGATGITDFEHLHFEIRENTILSETEPHINPFNYLPYNNTTTHTIEIVSPELIDPLNPTIQTHIVAPRAELDINKVKISIYDSQCNLLEEKEVDFNERNNCGSDLAIENSVELSPAQFNTDSTDYQLDVIFSSLTGDSTLLIVTEATDISGNTVYAEATVE
ncbi:peptidoglycan DD-metalloendopeptidase family protein, partial [Patescibacteria group bacterium]|nr:peptidoglycan DD-metalloendopeptidase family protein [Patescibacteria group bacterium]